MLSAHGRDHSAVYCTKTDTIFVVELEVIIVEYHDGQWQEDCLDQLG